jgi:hypothetical protein
MRRRYWYVLLCPLAALAAYARPLQRPPTPPEVTLSASREVVRPGEAVTLRWSLRGSSGWSTTLLPGIGPTTATAATLRPQLSTTYTLLAQRRGSSVQRNLRVEVQGTPRGAAPDAPETGGASIEEGGAQERDEAPSGTFGVSRRAEGPFLNDRVGGISEPDDERIVRVAPGESFYAQASFRDPDGIAEVVINLVNSSPEGLAGSLAPTRGPFTLEGEPQGACNLLALPTEVRCLFEIRVAEDAQNIDALPEAGDEFAYVFRVRVTDNLGNSANRPIRGYVIVEP